MITYMDVSQNRCTPKSSILKGFSIIFTIHFGVPLFLVQHPYIEYFIHVCIYTCLYLYKTSSASLRLQADAIPNLDAEVRGGPNSHYFNTHRIHVGVSKNTGTPKWMVKIMENPMNKWMIWGAHPYFYIYIYIPLRSSQRCYTSKGCCKTPWGYFQQKVVGVSLWFVPNITTFQQVWDFYHWNRQTWELPLDPWILWLVNLTFPNDKVLIRPY